LEIRKKEQIGDIGPVLPKREVFRITQSDLKTEGLGALIKAIGKIGVIRHRMRRPKTDNEPYCQEISKQFHHFLKFEGDSDKKRIWDQFFFNFITEIFDFQRFI
jgi:hypothetical protein